MSKDNSIEQNKNEGNSKKGIIVPILVVMVIALSGAVAAMAFSRGSGNISETPAQTDMRADEAANETEAQRRVIINEEDAEKIVSEMAEREYVPIGYYNVTMSTEWNFENGSAASGDAYVENSLSNTNPVYFDVTDAETDELIYSSPILTVGAHIDEIVLDKLLEAGTYDCICTYRLLDEDYNPISRVSVSVEIKIKN